MRSQKFSTLDEKLQNLKKTRSKYMLCKQKFSHRLLKEYLFKNSEIK